MANEHRGRRPRDEDSPAAAWKEKEILGGKTVDAGVMVLRTSGCSHFHKGGCSMCGYNIESESGIGPDNIRKQFDRAFDRVRGAQVIKLYTSGSFLDECEVPREAAEHILRRCADEHVHLLFESRPEYVTSDRLDACIGAHGDLEVALGLESANDRVLTHSINKGFTVKDYDSAAAELNGKGIPLRTYVLLKPPFLTEAEAIADAKATIAHAAKVSAVVSLNPVNVQKGTLVEKLWRSWAYRPPWLWSVLKVLREAQPEGKRLICDPTGGGKERGTHNCGECDGVILDSIKAFSMSQDPGRLGSPECDCQELWRSIVEVEGFVVGGTPDLQRFFRKQRA